MKIALVNANGMSIAVCITILATVLLDFPGFARHQIALKCNSMRGVYERQTVYRRIQERSGQAGH